MTKPAHTTREAAPIAAGAHLSGCQRTWHGADSVERSIAGRRQDFMKASGEQRELRRLTGSAENAICGVSAEAAGEFGQGRQDHRMCVRLACESRCTQDRVGWKDHRLSDKKEDMKYDVGVMLLRDWASPRSARLLHCTHTTARGRACSFLKVALADPPWAEVQTHRREARRVAHKAWLNSRGRPYAGQ